ncbi:MAG: DegT/DnrJ/EryC1/StrS family aminotransferase [bacterium]|nr:DegT/DnrJ/EryC1/StrS family aminotransferase [bacterium]MCP4965768.1 DegT/DnrJ/EryC1/StrS family aminotransferase [bacterium]
MIHLASPIIDDQEIDAVTRVMRSGMLAQGSEVAAFEKEFAATFNVGHAAAVANGTMALVVALRAAGVAHGDEVIVPSFTFAATANAVALAGGVPVFADIDAPSFNINPNEAAKLIGPKTKGIIAVHLYGQMAPMAVLADLAHSHDLFLIEDAAQAHGAVRDGLPVGALSDFSTYSFYPTKNMTTGEGGMVTSTNPDLIEAIRLQRNHGMLRRYHHDLIGTNARMTDISAAIGRVQLTKIAGWNEQRRAIAKIYDLHLAGIVDTPPVVENADHVYHQYTIRSEQRDAIVATCEDVGVGYGIYYPIPTHRQKAFARYATGRELEETDRAAATVLSIPIRPDLQQEEIDIVIDTITTGAKK